MTLIELTKEEYLKMKKELKSKNTTNHVSIIDGDYFLVINITFEV